MPQIPEFPSSYPPAPRENAASAVEQLTRTIVQALLPEALHSHVTVYVADVGDSLAVRVDAHARAVGFLVGRDGITREAVGDLLFAASRKYGLRANLAIVDTGGWERDGQRRERPRRRG